MAGDGSPVAGNVYSFRTSPLSEFAPPETGRYAAFKVLGVNERYVAIAVLEGIWSTPPSLRAANEAAVLHEYRFAHTGRMAAFGVNADWWTPSDLDDVSLLGSRRLSPEEEAIGAKIIGFGTGCSYLALPICQPCSRRRMALGTRSRRIHGRNPRSVRQRRLPNEPRRKNGTGTRLKNLTWEKLLAETPFERWMPSPPFPPAEFTEAARETIHNAYRRASRAGAKAA